MKNVPSDFINKRACCQCARMFDAMFLTCKLADFFIRIVSRIVIQVKCFTIQLDCNHTMHLTEIFYFKVELSLIFLFYSSGK